MGQNRLVLTYVSLINAKDSNSSIGNQCMINALQTGSTAASHSSLSSTLIAATTLTKPSSSSASCSPFSSKSLTSASNSSLPTLSLGSWPLLLSFLGSNGWGILFLIHQTWPWWPANDRRSFLSASINVLFAEALSQVIEIIYGGMLAPIIPYIE